MVTIFIDGFKIDGNRFFLADTHAYFILEGRYSIITLANEGI